MKKQKMDRRQLVRTFLIVVSFVFLSFSAYFFSIEEKEKVWSEAQYPPLPDFSQITNVSQKKKAFFEYVNIFVADVNARISEARSELLILRDIYIDSGSLSVEDEDWVRELAVLYKFEETDLVDIILIDNLLKRVDVVPASLALAQAANESGWGTSRFAKQGNNLYGMWCWTPGCGIVPARRNVGAKHEVAAYSHVGESVEAYIFNLNTSKPYLRFRAIRAALRSRGEYPSGISVARGLDRYSQRGWAYVEEIQSMIRSNQLSQYDENL